MDGINAEQYATHIEESPEVSRSGYHYFWQVVENATGFSCGGLRATREACEAAIQRAIVNDVIHADLKTLPGAGL